MAVPRPTLTLNYIPNKKTSCSKWCYCEPTSYCKSHKQYSKVSYFKWLGLLTLTKFWIHLLVNSSTSSFKNINSLTSKISISQYSICTYSILLSVHLHFNIFVALFSNYSFSTSLQQAFLQSCSDLFLSFSFHYSLNKVS